MQNNGTANRHSCGASELRRAPVEAVVTETQRVPTTEELTINSCSQTGTGQQNCPKPNCFLCNCELYLLTSFYSQFLQQETTNHLPTPIKEPGKDIDLLPCSIAIINYIQQFSTSIPLRALFDGGSDTTFIHKGCFPPGATPKLIQRRSGQTLAGLLYTNRTVELTKLVLPEFSRSSHANSQAAFFFKGQCNYDNIFGRDFLQKIGMSQDYDNGTMTAFNITTSMKPKSFYTNPFSALANILDDNDETYDCFAAILESK